MASLVLKPSRMAYKELVSMTAPTNMKIYGRTSLILRKSKKVKTRASNVTMIKVCSLIRTHSLIIFNYYFHQRRNGY
jgi:hypothetical protein